MKYLLLLAFDILMFTAPVYSGYVSQPGGGTVGGTGCTTSGGAVLKGDGAGGCANAVAPTDYISPSSKISDLSATTSAELAGKITNETGSGVLVFGTSPTIVTPTIASFASATHDHTNAAGGGQIGSGAITADSIGPTQIDETAAYTWTGAHNFDTGSTVDFTNTTVTGITVSEADTFASTGARGSLYGGANSAANSVKLGSTSTNRFFCFYDDPTDGRTINACDSDGNIVDVDYYRALASTKNWGAKNSSGAVLFSVAESGAMLVKVMAEPSGSAPTGYAYVYIDSTSKRLCNKSDAGVVTCTAP